MFFSRRPRLAGLIGAGGRRGLGCGFHLRPDLPTVNGPELSVSRASEAAAKRKDTAQASSTPCWCQVSNGLRCTTVLAAQPGRTSLLPKPDQGFVQSRFCLAAWENSRDSRTEGGASFGTDNVTASQFSGETRHELRRYRSAPAEWALYGFFKAPGCFPTKSRIPTKSEFSAFQQYETVWFNAQLPNTSYRNECFPDQQSILVWIY